MSQITISELSTNSYINELSDQEVTVVIGGFLPNAGGLVDSILNPLVLPDGTFSALIFYGAAGVDADVPQPFLTTEYKLGSGTGESLGLLGTFF